MLLCCSCEEQLLPEIAEVNDTRLVIEVFLVGRKCQGTDSRGCSRDVSHPASFIGVLSLLWAEVGAHP